MTWQEIFSKEAEVAARGGGTEDLVAAPDLWPSEDEEDDDFDPSNPDGAMEEEEDGNGAEGEGAGAEGSAESAASSEVTERSIPCFDDNDLQ
eukprot:7259570-Pyramimonas_sp.AAC.1